MHDYQMSIYKTLILKLRNRYFSLTLLEEKNE